MDSPADHEGASLKTEILAAMREHLRLYGPHNYALLQERPEFAHVIGKKAGHAGHRRFWRWLKSVREPMAPDKTRPHEARKAFQEAWVDASEKAKAAADHLPAAPSPALFLRMGRDADVKINLVEMIDEVWADIQRVREAALDGDSVKDPKLLMDSAKARTATIEQVVRLMREIYDFSNLRRLYEAIIDIIVNELQEAPEILAKILDRVEEVSQASALSPFAGER